MGMQNCRRSVELFGECSDANEVGVEKFEVGGRGGVRLYFWSPFSLPS